jgi:hypothetical protein
MRWQPTAPVTHNDQNTAHPDWYPFHLPELAGERFVGLVCSARNDRNYAPLVQLPGKTASCRDPATTHLPKSGRCIFSHVTPDPSLTTHPEDQAVPRPLAFNPVAKKRRRRPQHVQRSTRRTPNRRSHHRLRDRYLSPA